MTTTNGTTRAPDGATPGIDELTTCPQWCQVSPGEHDEYAAQEGQVEHVRDFRSPGGPTVTLTQIDPPGGTGEPRVSIEDDPAMTVDMAERVALLLGSATVCARRVEPALEQSAGGHAVWCTEHHVEPGDDGWCVTSAEYAGVYAELNNGGPARATVIYLDITANLEELTLNTARSIYEALGSVLERSTAQEGSVRELH